MGFLDKLLGNKSKPVSDGARVPELSTSIEKSILGVLGSRAVPPMPGAAQRAFQLSTNPRAEARDFIEVIESDESLSARVVRIANSVYFDRGKKAQTIEDSVLVIGLNELRCLLNATSLAELYPSNHPFRTTLWTHDIAVALASKLLARRLLPGQEDLAFLGGLMHDIGKLAMLQRLGNDYMKAICVIQDEGCEFVTAEERTFPFTHVEVGLLIAQRWKFDDTIKAVVADHHRKPIGVQLSSVVGLADTMCHALGIGHSPGFAKFQANYAEKAPQQMEILGLPAQEYKTLAADIQKSFEFERDLYLGKR
jgi:putative nucleotidyltransferase with HDIG domain